MRILTAAVTLTLVASCGGSAAPTTTEPPTFPSIVVDRWLEALVAGDYGAAAANVEPVGASIVVAIENGFSDQELAELLESGWTEALTDSFWSSFANEFGLFSGAPLDAIGVGRHSELDVGEGTYARVGIEVDGESGWILARLSDDGVWQVDLLATLAGAFVSLVFDRVAALGDSPAASLIATKITDAALGSLEAAAVAYPDDVRLSAEIARIRSVVGSR